MFGQTYIHTYIHTDTRDNYCNPLCACAPRVNYDDVLRSIVGSVANTCLDDNTWSQASLSVKVGRLGIRSAVQLAPSAFLSSAAASLDLVHHILPPSFGSQEVLHVDSALTPWSLGHYHAPPVAPASHRQKVWNTIKVSAIANDLVGNAPDAL